MCDATVDSESRICLLSSLPYVNMKLLPPGYGPKTVQQSLKILGSCLRFALVGNGGHGFVLLMGNWCWRSRSRVVARLLLSAPASPCLPNQPPVTRTRRRLHGLGRGEPPSSKSTDPCRSESGSLRPLRRTASGVAKWHPRRKNPQHPHPGAQQATTPSSLRWRWRVEMRVSLSGGFPNRSYRVPARAPRRRKRAVTRTRTSAPRRRR
ncbi:hypothetical protein EDB92DRAFT_1574829 [Lactarius akahatsu]|uniref:Uncharacterized protein n=1 Tax=Lactarius akahatsu TaxID=416441 RepID=A0AAD4L7M1_9AGAM|nr:hypothetical protein EDB92DRAFT_1574829 [Lactarius akahatsu]